MLWIWWPGFVVPVCMVLGGLGWKYVKRLPYRRKEALTAEQLRLARETFSRTLWQVGLALAAMTFMVMRSVRLMNVLPQKEYIDNVLPQELMTAAAIVLQILSTKLVEPAVQRSLHEKYGDTLPNGKEDDQ